jgi:hypothetical protein
MRRWEQLQRALAASFLVAAAQRVMFFPDRGFDDRQRNSATADHRFDNADGATVFEAGGCALLRHRLGALDERVLRSVPLNPAADSNHIDPLFGAYAGDRNVDRVDELRRSTIRVNKYDCQSAANFRIIAENVQAPENIAVNNLLVHERRKPDAGQALVVRLAMLRPARTGCVETADSAPGQRVGLVEGKFRLHGRMPLV